MNVLSVFDGMSCGQIALNRARVPYKRYFASEINKHAINVTQSNYPETVQLGPIEEIESWNIPDIDLLMGGSPCQGFSNMGKGFFLISSTVRTLKIGNQLATPLGTQSKSIRERTVIRIGNWRRKSAKNSSNSSLSTNSETLTLTNLTPI